MKKQDQNLFPNFHVSVAIREAEIWAKKYPEIYEIYLVRSQEMYSSLGPRWTIIWKVTKHPYTSPFNFALSMKNEFLPGFEDIYKDGGFYDWRREWRIEIVIENDEMPDDVLGDHYWVLYERASECDALQKKRKKYRSTEIREKVRSIAEELWIKYPDMTKADMALRDEISNACASMERLYAVATIERWIKDLNPDRTPGRRKKKPREEK